MARPFTSYSKIVPTDSFLGRYLTFMRRQETAYAFDFWAGLWCISSACARNVYVARPRAPVYLNMYVMLIGDSGVARKTTSVHTAGNLIRQVHAGGLVHCLDAKLTAEKLDDLLHDRTMEHGSGQLCMAIPELAVFLGTESYMTSMPTLLTDLYDCPSHRRGGGTVTRGECIQRNVWINILSASTPVWLVKSVNPTVIEGGFTSRCMFIISNEPKQKIPWPDGADTEDERAWLLSDLVRIRNLAANSDPILPTDGAIATFRKWYNSRDHALDTYQQTFESREDAHVLRIAALLCINDDSWRIDHQHVVNAIRLVASVKDGGASIFRNVALRNDYATSLDLIRRHLITAGMDPVVRHVLVRRCRRDLDIVEFNALLDVLHELGAIQRFINPEQDRGRPTELFRGTEALMSKGLGERVLEKFA